MPLIEQTGNLIQNKCFRQGWKRSDNKTNLHGFFSRPLLPPPFRYGKPAIYFKAAPSQALRRSAVSFFKAATILSYCFFKAADLRSARMEDLTANRITP